VIAQAGLVVSNDSVALHLAVALGRPVIGVVGPTGPAPGFAPLPPHGAIVAHPDLACRPCSPHGHARCPLGHHRCMRELEVERVLREVAAMLGR
jgi:heptosyltransferase-2